MAGPHSSPSLHLIPYGDTPAATIARCLLRRFEQHLPDFTKGVVLLPSTSAAANQRRDLLEAMSARGYRAILGPVMATFRAWVEHLVVDSQPVADYHTGQLLLVEALHGHTRIFGDQDPWRIAESLIPFFEELTLHQVPLPGSVETITQRLQQAYGITGIAPPALGREAAILHRLWQAWREQLAAEGLWDGASAYLHKLQQIPACLPADSHIILIDYLHPLPAELELIRKLLNQDRLELILQGHPGATEMHPDAPLTALLNRLGLTAPDVPDLQPYAAFLHAAYPRQGSSLRTRAQHIQQSCPDSPARPRLALYAADSAEQEAQAIDVQIRRWLVQGMQPIGVVTQDRKLARRLRALLERAGVPLHDMGGWALSTTSAAAMVERWLETVETDFHHQPLLDLLKSPFLCAGPDREQHLTAVYRLEQDVILHENVPSGLERYRRQLGYRSHRLAWSAPVRQQIEALLTRVESAAAPLLALFTGLHKAPLLLEHLRLSLETLGLWAALEEDLAGQQLLHQWRILYRAAQRRPIDMNWLDFRTWLGRCLETQNFKPSQAVGAVQLLTLEQSNGCRFAAVVGGAFDQQHFPGQGSPSPFFNNRVRAELGLPTWHDKLQQRLHDFRALLECAPQVLLTWRSHENGEPQSPSPWLEAVQVLHQLAYGDDLQDPELTALLARPESRVQAGEPAPLQKPGSRPSPALPVSLRPSRLSATAHQRLIDCPYQFFAADGLGLKPLEAVKTLLERSDYGERIHRCLQAFHGNVTGLPGPFTEPVTQTSRERAIALLEEISHAVFAKDLEDNFLHRGWLKRWQGAIPKYIDWQLQRETHWRVQETEASKQTSLGPDLSLHGRLDRVDSGIDGSGIIDYKTGGVPDQETIDSGEAVQLPTYSLVHQQPVARVEYLRLERDKVSTAGCLQGDALEQLQTAVRIRLTELISAIDHGSPMPAWGDAMTCSRCEMEGLCRRGLWITGNGSEAQQTEGQPKGTDLFEIHQKPKWSPQYLK